MMNDRNKKSTIKTSNSSKQRKGVSIVIHKETIKARVEKDLSPPERLLTSLILTESSLKDI